MKKLLKKLRMSISKFFHPVYSIPARSSDEDQSPPYWYAGVDTGLRQMSWTVGVPVSSATEEMATQLTPLTAQQALDQYQYQQAMIGQSPEIFSQDSLADRLLVTSTPNGFSGIGQFWGGRRGDPQEAPQMLPPPDTREAINVSDSEDLGLVFSSEVSPVTCPKCFNSFAVLDEEDEAGGIVFCTNPECGEEIELEATSPDSDYKGAILRGRALGWGLAPLSPFLNDTSSRYYSEYPDDITNRITPF